MSTTQPQTEKASIVREGTIVSWQGGDAWGKVRSVYPEGAPVPVSEIKGESGTTIEDDSAAVIAVYQDDGNGGYEPKDGDQSGEERVAHSFEALSTHDSFGKAVTDGASESATEKAGISIHDISYDSTSTSSDWSKPAQSDWPENTSLSSIAQAFVASKSNFPPDNYSDLSLPICRPDSDGNLVLVLGGLDSAWKTAAAVDGMTDDQASTVKTKLNNLAEDEFDRSLESDSETDSKSDTDTDTDTDKFVKTVSYKNFNEDERTATGVILVPHEVDLQGDFLDATTIKQFSSDFMRQWQAGSDSIKGGGVLHAGFPGTDHLSLDENNITDAKQVIGDEKYPAGTWTQTWKFHDDDLWGLVKDGYLSGFSIGGAIDTSTTYKATTAQEEHDVVIPRAVKEAGLKGDSTVRCIESGSIKEVSVVDIPAVPRANITTLKSTVEKGDPRLLDSHQSCKSYLSERGWDDGGAERMCSYLQRSGRDDQKAAARSLTVLDSDAVITDDDRTRFKTLRVEKGSGKRPTDGTDGDMGFLKRLWSSLNPFFGQGDTDDTDDITSDEKATAGVDDDHNPLDTDTDAGTGADTDDALTGSDSLAEADAPTSGTSTDRSTTHWATSPSLTQLLTQNMSDTTDDTTDEQTTDDAEKDASGVDPDSDSETDTDTDTNSAIVADEFMKQMQTLTKSVESLSEDVQTMNADDDSDPDSGGDGDDSTSDGESEKDASDSDEPPVWAQDMIERIGQLESNLADESEKDASVSGADADADADADGVDEEPPEWANKLNDRLGRLESQTGISKQAGPHTESGGDDTSDDPFARAIASQ